ncbi:MAG: GNAT family N-acetyltransferase [Actinomycetes bacterium]
MTIREVPADDAAVVALAAAQQTELNVRYGAGLTESEIDRVRSTPQPPLSPAARWLLIEEEGQAVGCVAVQSLAASHDRPQTGEIKRLFVRLESRGHGHSRMLMTAAEELARTLGFIDLWLETGMKQPEAMSLYETSGWTPITPYGYWRDSPNSRAFAKIL